jgi:hypothetical protein
MSLEGRESEIWRRHRMRNYSIATLSCIGAIKACLPEYGQQRRELLWRKPDRVIHQYSDGVLRRGDIAPGYSQVVSG